MAKKVHNIGDNIPWPRQNYAQMIHDIRQKNAGIIVQHHVSREGSIWRRRDSSELDQRKRDSFVPTSSSKRNPEFRPTLAQGRLDPQINPILAKNGPNPVTNIPSIEEHAEGIGVIASAPQPDNQQEHTHLLLQ